MQSPKARIGIGLALAAFAQFLALFLSGSGEGWNTPMFVSAGLWFLIPLTFAAAWHMPPADKPMWIGLTVIALAADALLVGQSLGEAPYIRHYVDVNGAVGLAIIGLWLCLWFCWQVIVLHRLVARHEHA